MCSDNAPAAPTADPAIAEAAARQAKLGQEYLDFTKQQFAVSQGMQADLNNTLKTASDSYLGMAKQDRARYDNVFLPLQDAYIKTANEYATPANQEAAAAKASADVQTAAGAQRDASERNLQSVGVRPDSGRFAGIDKAVGLGTALGSVDAANRARETVRNTGLALKRDAINVGAGLPGQSMAETGAGLTAASQPVTTHMASTGIVQPGYSAALTGNKNQAEALNTEFKTNASLYDTQAKMDAANAAGIGNLFGTIGGAALKGVTSPGFATSGLGLLLSSKKLKTNRKDVADGDGLDAVESMPVQTYDYKPGVADGGSHVGPMAEDFKAATGHGDGKTIAVQDAIGISMKAIQDLSKKVNRIADAIGLGGPSKRSATA